MAMNGQQQVCIPEFVARVVALGNQIRAGNDQVPAQTWHIAALEAQLAVIAPASGGHQNDCIFDCKLMETEKLARIVDSKKWVEDLREYIEILDKHLVE